MVTAEVSVEVDFQLFQLAHYLRVKNCKKTDHRLTHHYIKSHRELWKGENDPDSEEMPGGKHPWDR